MTKRSVVSHCGGVLAIFALFFAAGCAGGGSAPSNTPPTTMSAGAGGGRTAGASGQGGKSAGAPGTSAGASGQSGSPGAPFDAGSPRDTGGSGGAGGNAGVVGNVDAAQPAGDLLRPAAFACPAAPFPAPMAMGTPTTPVTNRGFTEGPVWIAAQKALYFSQINFSNVQKGGVVLKFTPADGQVVEVAKMVGTNGLAATPDGNILAGAHDIQSLAKYDVATTMRADLALSMMFNSPNDLVVRGDGHVYFTDPNYQLDGRKGPGYEGVYHLPPGGQVKLVEMRNKPNGINLSPDGKWLYVASSEGGPIKRHPIAADGTVGEGKSFITGTSDGMAVDCAGNIYLSQGGVVIYDPDAKMIGRVNGLSEATNMAFGGDDGKTLFVTSGNGGKLSWVKMNVPGLPN